MKDRDKAKNDAKAFFEGTKNKYDLADYNEKKNFRQYIEAYNREMLTLEREANR